MIFVMAVWLLVTIASSFDIKPYIATCWNVETFNTIGGESSDRQFYHINFTLISNETGLFQGLIYKGDCPLGENIDDRSKSAAEIEIQMTDWRSGSLSLVEPERYDLTEFKFVESFTHLLGAYGVYNGTTTYAANLINLATFHVTLFSGDTNVMREALFTVIKRDQGEPWYERYGNYVSFIGAAVVTFVALHVMDPAMKWFGSGSAPAKEEPHVAK